MGMFDDFMRFLNPNQAAGPPTAAGQRPTQLGGFQSMLSQPGVAQGLLAAGGQLMQPGVQYGPAAQAFTSGLQQGQQGERQKRLDKLTEAKLELEQERVRREQEAQAKQAQYLQGLAAQGNPAAAAMLSGIDPSEYGMLNPQPEYRDMQIGSENVTVRVNPDGTLEPTMFRGPKFSPTPQVQVTNQYGSIPAGYRMVDDPETGDVRLEQVPGAPLTESQANTSVYVERMGEADKLLRKIEAEGYDPASTVEHARAGVPFIGNYLSSKENQQYRQAQEDWVRAKLRKESGAVIAEEEMNDEVRTYFPQPGDSAEVVAQKARARKTAERAMAAGLPAGPNPKGGSSARAGRGGVHRPQYKMIDPQTGRELSVNYDDILDTARQRNLTPEQVIERMGIRVE